MSKRNREKYLLRTRYFDYLRETAEVVDPYVKRSIDSFSLIFPENVNHLMTQRYRFGKSQLRPASVRMAYELVGGTDWKSIIPACAAIEIRDTAYYCYDDVVDSGANSDLFLLANTFISLSNNIICKAENIEIMKEMFSLDKVIITGGFLEKENLPSESECLKKAFCFNFWEQAFKIGAILSCANNEIIYNLSKIGKYIGASYIIANDTWDFGKEEMEDFQNGKYTIPIIFAMENSKENKFLIEMFGRKLSEIQKDKIRKIMIDCGSIRYGQEVAWKYFEKALNLLKKFPDTEIRNLIEFSGTIIWKNKYFDELKKIGPP